MTKRKIIILSTITLLTCIGWVQVSQKYTADQLRQIYSQPSEHWPEPHVDEDVEFREIGLMPDNPYRNVDSLKPVIELGKVLFFDPRLSSSNQISCATCHDPELGWSNGRSQSVGHNHQVGKRNSPGLNNIWQTEPLFWDGRAATLEEQALMPVEDPIEMHQKIHFLPTKLSKIEGYKKYFIEAFGDDSVTTERLSSALAYFQRSLTSRTSDFDQFMKGRKDALSDEAIQGMHLFRTKARCINCHNGPFFTDNKFHNLGLHFYGGRFEDLGRFDFTGDPKDIGKFKTPSLRDVMYTGPWMHNGFFNDIMGIMQMYDNGMARPKPRPGMEDDPNFPETSHLLKKLDLSLEEKEHLIAFLHALSAPNFRMARPEIPK
ncbi:cytochrome c peroxidase [Belliella buryatensis]|uniref:Methylamine utilization protein MauG n=1 Tax=Belliella buryatensis TaxID=1500549 RepID=A0A239ERI9_9BACT|nr:cytochrome c peroxidase [Belliella buryatensis]SNS47370.1 cytochrome c peroxidase [Belliella buryatensis]